MAKDGEVAFWFQASVGQVSEGLGLSSSPSGQRRDRAPLSLPVFGGGSAGLSMLGLAPLLLKRKLYRAYCTE